ncbi:MAG: metalloregulator ArsR/SmtB family transcription factor [Alphaproteobacteria bacterium]|nr:metalloregulator ArsR/SmtB family transcription factor [Alphaproteobacteria bacterium]
MAKNDAKPKTRRDIMNRLKSGGCSDATALAEGLGVTPMAIRQHLYDLQAEGLVESRTEPRPVGRPAKLWYLTEAADRYFPDAHAELAVGLIDAIRASMGDDALDALVRERSRSQTELYRSAMEDAPDLRSKLDALAEIRSREGYMAGVEEADDGLVFVENHCPICAAAKACTGLCAMELQVFSEALGPDYAVERTDHILAGARRCAYHVRPRETATA